MEKCGLLDMCWTGEGGCWLVRWLLYTGHVLYIHAQIYIHWVCYAYAYGVQPDEEMEIELELIS